MKWVLSVITLVTLSVEATTHAQINGATPPLMGQQSFHIWSVPGVIDTGGIATFFACTNTTDAAIRVGVEVFGPAGGAAINDPSATSLNVAPSATVLFGTGGAVGLSVSGTLGAGIISKGSGRVLATVSKGIICSAFLADPNNDPVTSMSALTIVKKTRQKGN